jgi:hypothetical protein
VTVSILGIDKPVGDLASDLAKKQKREANAFFVLKDPYERADKDKVEKDYGPFALRPHGKREADGEDDISQFALRDPSAEKPKGEKKSEAKKEEDPTDEIDTDILAFLGKRLEGTSHIADANDKLNDLKDLTTMFGKPYKHDPLYDAFWQGNMFNRMTEDAQRAHGER